jgi:hypothetical protein
MQGNADIAKILSLIVQILILRRFSFLFKDRVNTFSKYRGSRR